MKILALLYGIWRHNMLKRIQTDQAPAAIGTYSQGTVNGQLVFTSGQIAIHPQTGDLIVDNFGEEVRQVLCNLRSVLEGGGSSMSRIIKLTVFMTDLSGFNELNLVFEEFFPKDPPARSVVQVAALPKNVHVEIEAIGSVG